MARIIRSCGRLLGGLITLTITVGVLVGIPLTLTRALGSPWSTHLPDLDELRRRLESGEVRGPLIAALAVLVWVTWARLALAFAVLFGARVRRVRIPTVGVLGSAQGVAAGMLTGLALLVPAGGGRASAAAHSGPVVARPPAASPVAASPAAPSPRADDVWTVRRGDTLWRIAEARLGDGRQWRRIWALNQDRKFGDRVFDDPDLILPGWRLLLPNEQVGAPRREPAHHHADGPINSPKPAPDAPNPVEPPAVDRQPIVADVPAPRPIPPLQTATDPGNVDSRPLTVPDVLFPGGLMLPSSATGGEDATAPAVPPADTLPPGTLTPDTSTPDTSMAPSVAEQSVADEDASRSLPAGLAAGALIAGGAVLVGRRRRRSRSRAAATSPAPSPVMRLDQIVYELDPAARLERLERAWSVVVGCLRADQRDAQPLVGVVAGSGEIDVHFDTEAGEAPQQFRPLSARCWRLPADVATRALDPPLVALGAPRPLLAHVGRKVDVDDLADVFVDLRASRGLDIDASEDGLEAFIEAFIAALSASALARDAELIVVDATGDERSVRPPDDGAWGPTVMVTMSSAQRCSARGAEEDTFVVGPGLGGPDVAGARLRLRRATSGWLLDPLDIPVVPLGLERDDVDAVRQLLAAAANEETSAMSDATDSGPAFLVRMLGPVAVHDATGDPVVFERAKSLELVCWLALHRTAATRASARAALWDSRIRDATFSNVVSEARRAFARHMHGRVDEGMITRSNGDQLRLDSKIRCDADIVEQAVSTARSGDDETAIAALQSALSLVRGAPLSGTGYVWADAEGITARLTMLVLAAAADLGERQLGRGELDGVLWATGVGLGVLAGHEDLIALRMRAYAGAGDLAGVRSEWEAYERAVAADPWVFAVSARLEALRKELLHPALSNRP